MAIGVVSIHIQLPGCASLKEKRSRLKPLLARLHREFNVSVAEMAYQDVWQSAEIACAMVANDARLTQRALTQIVEWIENNWPDVMVSDQHLEII